MDEEEIAEFSPKSCISQHVLVPVVLDYFFYVLLRCPGQGTGQFMHTEAKTGGINSTVFNILWDEINTL